MLVTEKIIEINNNDNKKSSKIIISSKFSKI